jgi:hypothetical protein
MADREAVTHRRSDGDGDSSSGSARSYGGGGAGPPPPPYESVNWVERGLDSALPIGVAEPSAAGVREEPPYVVEAGPASLGRGRRRIGDRVFAVLTAGQDCSSYC